MIVLSDRALATDVEFSASRSRKRLSPQVGVLRYSRDVFDDATTTPISGPSIPQTTTLPRPTHSLSTMRMKILQAPVIVLIILSGLFILGALLWKLVARGRYYRVRRTHLRPRPTANVTKGSFLDMDKGGGAFPLRHTILSTYSIASLQSGKKGSIFGSNSWIKRSSSTHDVDVSNKKRQNFVTIDLHPIVNTPLPYGYPRAPPPAYVAAEGDRQASVIHSATLTPPPFSQPGSPLYIEPDVPRSPLSPSMISPVSPISPKSSPGRSFSFKWRKSLSRGKSIKSSRSRKSSLAPLKKLPRLVNVVSDFAPLMPDDLAIKAGDTLRLLEEYENSWCLVQRLGLEEGDQGFVPSRCLIDRPDVIPILQRKAANLAFPVHRPVAYSSIPPQGVNVISN